MQPAMLAPSPSPPPAHVIVATHGAGANLRAPTTAGPVIATLAEGTPVDILGDPVSVEGRSWRQIRGEGREGWVVSVVVRER
jgi:SH3-like domain-containing protein